MTETYEIPAKWERCYEDNWETFITPESFQHPAKFARGLISRIYLEMLAAGMVEQGDTVVDPFGGIAGGGIIAAGLGLQWLGCELEEKFWKLGNQNIDLHRRMWEQFGDPVPVLVNGDSRRLRENLAGVLADVVCSSPPYAESVVKTDGGYDNEKLEAAKVAGATASRATWGTNKGSGGQVGYGQTPGQLGSLPPGSVEAVVSSPPYAETSVAKSSGGVDLQKQYETYRSQGGGASFDSFCKTQRLHSGDYGSSEGQLSKLPAGNVDSIVSSPPYAESLRGDGSQQETAAESREKRRTEGGSLGQSCRTAGYGGKDNLGNLAAGDVDAVVSSPPWENQEAANSARKHADPEAVAAARSEGYASGRLKGNYASKEAILRAMNRENDSTYGTSDGQLGIETGETFWHAARDIVRESYAILKPGGHSVWVVKAFVRNKAIVDFPGDWQKLCESVGFVLVKEVRAMLVSEERHPDLFGGEDHVKTKARMSFFRRLHTKKYPHLAINYEVVQFFRKPR